MLVPTSCETLSQFKWRGLLTHTVPLELAVQLSILQWARFPTPQVYITAELRYSYWRSSQVRRNILCSQGKAVAADQMHRHGANPEPRDTPLLAYGVSRECLSWINKRQNQLPVFLSKVLERQPNTFSTFWTKAYVFNHWVIILLFCGISQTNLHSYGKGRRTILFHFILL